MSHAKPLILAAFFSLAAVAARAGCTYDVKTKAFTPDGCQHDESRMGQDIIDAAEAAAANPGKQVGDGKKVTNPATATDGNGTKKGATTGHNHDDDPPYPRDEALKHIRDQFDDLREEFRGNANRLAIVNATQKEFENRLRGIPGDTFPASEVDVLDDMYRAQMTYSREKRMLDNARGRLTQEQYNAKLAEIEQRHSEAMQDIHDHGGPKSELVTALHAAIDNAVNQVCGGGRCKPGSRPDDFVPIATPPGRHGQDMLNQYGNDPSVLEMAAKDKLAAGDVAGGLAMLNKAIANGGTADAYGMRGGIMLDKGDYQAAYLDAKKALEMNPGDKNLMGLLKSAEGRVSPEFLASVRGGGSGASASSGGGSRSGSSPGFAGYAGADSFGTGGARSVPGMTSGAVIASNVQLEAARRAMAMGDFAAAVAAAQKALALNPDNAAAHAFLAAIYAGQKQYSKSLASASAGLALAPRDGVLLNSKAFAENRLRKYNDALASSNGAIEADPRNPFGYANRAHAYGGLGRRDEMMSDIERAASMDPSFKKAAADAAALQLPSTADLLFLFPGEDPVEKKEAPGAPRRSIGAVLGAGLIGGVLLALGLLSTVLAPVKDSIVSAFTKVTRTGPTLHDVDQAEEAGASAAAAAAGINRGQYEIVRQIGAGGMGTVYEGKDRSLGRRVAIKKMREELRQNVRERERFVIEAKTVASLHHPNIVDIYAITEEGDDVYLVFEYVDGKTVHDVIQMNGRLSPVDAARVTRAVADALAYAHAHGVIHRDMKPSNVMINPAGIIKVMDFGIARLAKDALTRYSMTNTVVGTPPYMAPEQEQGVVRKESDVYSLAVCSYEMLTGKLPFIGVAAGMLMNKINMSYIPPSRATAGLPGALDEVFAKAFQADPENRYRTPQEFAAALERALGGSVRAS